MNAGLQPHWREDFDEPWRRLPLIVPLALITWVVLLAAFARMIERRAAPQPAPSAIEARIVELPPSPAGLQGGGAPAGAKTVTHPSPPLPKPVVKPKRPPVHHVKKRIVKAPPTITEPLSPFGTIRHSEPSAPVASRGPTTGAVSSPRNRSVGGIGGGTGEGSGAGIGSDSSGAHAMYAPTPTIPDDMRETTFQR